MLGAFAHLLPLWHTPKEVYFMLPNCVGSSLGIYEYRLAGHFENGEPVILRLGMAPLEAASVTFLKSFAAAVNCARPIVRCHLRRKYDLSFEVRLPVSEGLQCSFGSCPHEDLGNYCCCWEANWFLPDKRARSNCGFGESVQLH